MGIKNRNIPLFRKLRHLPVDLILSRLRHHETSHPDSRFRVFQKIPDPVHVILVPVGHDRKIQTRHPLALKIRHQNLLSDGFLLAAAAVHQDRMGFGAQNDSVALAYVEECGKPGGA